MAGARRLEDEVRVGLELVESKPAFVDSAPRSVDPLDVISFGKPVRRHVRDFGVLFAAICLGVAAWQAYKGKPASSFCVWAAVGVVFCVLGVFAPRALRPVWSGWMKFAHYLSIVMTFVLLLVTWCVGFVPMAIGLKFFKVRRMDLSYRATTVSYWETRDPKYDDFKRLELQY